MAAASIAELSRLLAGLQRYDALADAAGRQQLEGAAMGKRSPAQCTARAPVSVSPQPRGARRFLARSSRDRLQAALRSRRPRAHAAAQIRQRSGKLREKIDAALPSELRCRRRVYPEDADRQVT